MGHAPFLDSWWTPLGFIPSKRRPIQRPSARKKLWEREFTWKWWFFKGPWSNNKKTHIHTKTTPDHPMKPNQMTFLQCEDHAMLCCQRFQEFQHRIPTMSNSDPNFVGRKGTFWGKAIQQKSLMVFANILWRLWINSQPPKDCTGHCILIFSGVTWLKFAQISGQTSMW